MCRLGGEGKGDEALPFCYGTSGVSKYSLGKKVCSLGRDENNLLEIDSLGERI